MARHRGHLGPFQMWTEICMACGENIYVTDNCVEEEEAQRILAEHEASSGAARIQHEQDPLVSEGGTKRTTQS